MKHFVLAFLSISLMSFLSWGVLAVYFAYAQNFSRLGFIFFHYLTSFLAFFIFFFILYKFLPHFSPFWTMISAMIVLFVIEIIVFSFFYKGELWFLNFLDWMVPVFIISSTIYLLGVFLS